MSYINVASLIYYNSETYIIKHLNIITQGEDGEAGPHGKVGKEGPKVRAALYYMH